MKKNLEKFYEEFDEKLEKIEKKLKREKTSLSYSIMMKFLSGITRNLNQLMILKEQHEFLSLILEEEKMKKQGSLSFWDKLVKEKCILLL